MSQQIDETIQIQVPSELARRLRLHYDDLPKILEWGLRQLEDKIEADSLSPAAESKSPPERGQVLAALRSMGILVDLDPAIAVQYQASADRRQNAPVQVNGTPLSEMIVAERRQQWDDDQ